MATGTCITGNVVKTITDLDCGNMAIGGVGIITKTTSQGSVQPGDFVVAGCKDLIFFCPKTQESWWAGKQLNCYFYRKLEKNEYLTLTQDSE